MSEPVCVNCQNSKPVNLTDNRLVTESCGHVKCVGCLVQEKDGCAACRRESQELALLAKAEEKKKETEDITETEQETVEATPKTPLPKKKKPDNKHILVINNGEEKYYLCTVCNKQFHSRSQVSYHSYCNGQSKPFQCPECNKGFASQSHFTYHMRVHRNERTYACESCGEGFFQMCKLQRHRLIHHTKEKNYSCEICDKAFNNFSALRKHGLIHSEERPYRCEKCGFRFRDASNLKKHLFNHDLINSKCSCSVCGTEVSSKRSLLTHALLHQRRAFQCPRCPHAFHSQKDLRRHAAVHSDSKPFRCKVCTRCFRRKDNLERHIRSKHPNFVPAAAVECDETALNEQQTTTNHPQTTITITDDGNNLAEEKEKTILQQLNPLPPLPKDVIQQINEIKNKSTFIDNTPLPSPTDLTTKTDEKSYIIEANNARQSVIFGPIAKSNISDKVETESEYVHKIRKANLLAKQNDLPPIDEIKFMELQQNKTLDVGVPSKNVGVYEKILSKNEGGDEKGEGHGPEMHWKWSKWRRKMKLNINWLVCNSI